MKHPVRFFVITLFYTAPLTVVGLALCMTLIGIPLGIVVLGLAAKPLADLIESGIIVEKNSTKKAAPQDEPMPVAYLPDLVYDDIKYVPYPRVEVPEEIIETTEEIVKPWKIY